MNRVQQKKLLALTVIRANEMIREGAKFREQFHCIRGSGFCSETGFMRTLREYAYDHNNRELVILQYPGHYLRFPGWESRLLQSLQQKLLSANLPLRIQSPSAPLPENACGVLLLPSAYNFCKAKAFFPEAPCPVFSASSEPSNDGSVVSLDMRTAWHGYLLELIRQNSEALLVLGSEEIGEELHTVWNEIFSDRGKDFAIACVPEAPSMAADPVFVTEIFKAFPPKVCRIAVFCETQEYQQAWQSALNFGTIPEDKLKQLVPPVSADSIFDMAEDQAAEKLLAMLLGCLAKPDCPTPGERVYAALKSVKK